MFKRLKPAIVVEVFIHVLFWAFITVTPILSHPYPPPGFRHLVFKPEHFIVVNLLLAVQFYLNAFLLIPVFLNKYKSIGLYFGLLIISFVTIDVIMAYTRPHFMHDDMPRPSFAAGFNIFPLAAITAAGFAYHYLFDQFKIINNQREIANATLVSELAFLRSQISPHFIFNVINSIVALSRLNPVAVEPTLIQLSQLLRYMLYITDEEKVTLRQKEEYLRSYIELQRLRFHNQVTINFTSEIESGEKTIEPMLLIPFLENAFKYGTGDMAHPGIVIYLKTKNNLLDFYVQNAYNPKDKNKEESHGIGINNVKRRLELLYPGKHSLLIDQSEHFFKVKLQIKLK